MIFMMSQILYLSKKSRMPVNALYAMNAKIAQRLKKLSDIDSALLQKIRKSTTETHDEIKKRWHLQQESDVRHLDLEGLRELDFDSDSILSLPEMAQYLLVTKAHENPDSRSKFHPTNGLVTYTHDDLPKNIGDPDATIDVISKLNAFENWIGDNLLRWRESQNTEGACVALAKLLESY
jgi:hypothetical protein